MKLGTVANGTRDGALVVVARNLSTFLPASDIAPNLLTAIENWDICRPALEALAARVETNGQPLDLGRLLAPLPRSHQFVDASAFLNHGHLMEKAFHVAPKLEAGVPVLVQRQADDFRSAYADFEFRSEADNADFEGEVAVVTDDVPMGVSASDAMGHIKLIMLFNDVSMRAFLQRELGMGFGFFLSKPATVFAPVAITPEELGVDWREGRVHRDMIVTRNGERFGSPNGGEMDFSFGEIIAYLAYNRRLRAGTIIGSGTFSNKDTDRAGSACIGERRALEMLSSGKISTGFLKNGERIGLDMTASDGGSLFGAIDHAMMLV